MFFSTWKLHKVLNWVDLFLPVQMCIRTTPLWKFFLWTSVSWGNTRSRVFIFCANECFVCLTYLNFRLPFKCKSFTVDLNKMHELIDITIVGLDRDRMNLSYCKLSIASLDFFSDLTVKNQGISNMYFDELLGRKSKWLHIYGFAH